MNTLLKMVEVSINDVLLGVPYDCPRSDAKPQKLLQCILTENCKQYLNKVHTEEQVNELSAEEVDKLFGNYEPKSGQMVKSLGKSISEWPATLSKYAGLGTAMAAELMIGFRFGVRVILAVGVVDGLNHYEQQMRLPPLKWQNKLSYNK